jgi:hypothetical protein
MSIVPDGHRALAVAAGLLVHHHRRPDLVRIDVVARFIAQARGFGLEDARTKALAYQRPLPIATIGVEPIAHDRLAVADHVGDDGDQAQRHAREVDVGVADLALDGLGGLADVDDLHGMISAAGSRPRRWRCPAP